MFSDANQFVIISKAKNLLIILSAMHGSHTWIKKLRSATHDIIKTVSFQTCNSKG